MNKTAVMLVAVAVLAGCAARSAIQKPRGQEALSPHTGPVCFLKSPLPSNVGHTVVGQIKSSKRTYGSVGEIIPLMADEARRAGADVITNVVTGQRFGALAWARPVGSGVAVKLDDPSTFNCLALGGELR